MMNQRLKTIEIDLDGVRLPPAYPEQLLFQRPSLAALMTLANQLVKFEFPPLRNKQAFCRFLQNHLVSTGVSKKMIGTLPDRWIVQCVQRLWLEGLDLEVPTRPDRVMTCMWAAQDVQEFLARELIVQSEGLGEGFDDLLADISENPQLVENADRQWIEHCLANPLPWISLLSRLSAASAACIRLRRLKDRFERLSGQYPDSADDFMEPLLAELRLHQLEQYRLLLLVEGTTEELLLPCFARYYGLNWETLGVIILPTGGKNQMAAVYQSYARVLNMPVVVLLDQDADRASEDIRHRLRPGDRLIRLDAGEFEDLYELAWIIDTVNEAFHPYPPLTLETYAAIMAGSDPRVQSMPGLKLPESRVAQLKLLWQVLALGPFDKITFAEHLARSMDLKSASLKEQQFQPAQPNHSGSMATLPMATLIGQIMDTFPH